MTEETSTTKAAEATRAVIIGTGFAGLCMAIKLKAAGINDFIILEKAEDVGGTWRENTYPGAECDIPTALYSFSFEQNPDWDYKWAAQKQIHGYIKSVAEKHDIYSHVRFKHRLRTAVYNQAGQHWQLECEAGETFLSQFFITAVGQLHHPSTPHIPGIESFQGNCFHSANWDHNADLKGKKIAVIGTGASAIQFIPPLAEQADELHVFQRSPNWIMPKLDSPYTEKQKQIRARLPIINRIDRLRMWLRSELGLFRAMKGNKLAQGLIKWMCLRHLNNGVKDPEKREKLTPNYTVGAKRILFSDNYYTGINRSNVSLHTEKVTNITSSGIGFDGGEINNIDTIIYGTGFITNPFLSDLDIRGIDGLSIHQEWSQGARAYLGVSCAKFPNFFMLYGPNTNLGHNSIILMIEAQAKYIVQAIQLTEQKNKRAIDVKPEVEQIFNDKLQARLRKMVWTEVDSWYMDGERITNNWAGGTAEYMLRMSTLKEQDYSLS